MSRVAVILLAWLLAACASVGSREVLILPALFVCGSDPYGFEHPRGKTIKLPHASPAKSALYAPQPQYPYEARLKLWEDTLLVELHVRPDGTVSHVEIVQHSRYPVLDYCAKEAFRQWRFRPGTADRLRIPLTFSLHCPE
jgi:TonB family protein